ncbi:oxidoreductase [Tabrizicola sp.]|uniref:oxidoreductase n=1 Tax=Tabrizicola sp. TaxID=2005166 RepID=UPI002732C6B4|nr:oxidoreductase [Tabrizicola sp.]MDP3196180.1 oxidoreductase [Tabrizicola sp.]MDZ4068689.1 oxidoreductase [Tabrizicola sp.]
MHLLIVLPRLALGLAAVVCFATPPSIAGAQDPSEVLLELVPKEGANLELTRAELEALPQVQFETTTGWTEGSARYSGPRLSEVLALAGLSEQAVEATAANDYSVIMDRDLIGPIYPIIALRINGKPFGKRELGPLWVIYPYDLLPEYRSERVFAASIWQLVSLAHVNN